MEKKKAGGGLSFLLVIGILIVWYVVAMYVNDKGSDYLYSEFLNDISNNKVAEVFVGQNKEIPTGYLEVKFKSGTTKFLYVNDVNQAIEDINEAKVTYILGDVERDNVFLTIVLPIMLSVIVVFFLFMLLNANAAGGGGGGNSKLMNFGKSRATRIDPEKNGKTFNDVAGLTEEKEDLEEIVDFLKNPAKYIEVGARIPKGVILEGPPGTGKTLLAKAIAGEAGVPFFSISGSDFVEMFVGVGASRVRDLFEEAKKSSPCMIFIDEIDAVARRRGTGMGGGHDEREQTLNQMLVEMDGFNTNEGIIVLAATNRVDILDPAILRPGRFDRRIVVGRPDIKAREEILCVHAKNKPLAEDVDLSAVAKTTVGFTGADLENLLNEAAIIAAKNDKKFIVQDDINRSFIKLGIGTEKKSKVVTEQEKKITAYHESGHAILLHVLDQADPVHIVSIIPTGNGAGGYTMHRPEKDEMYYTRGKMLQEIMVSLGGRIAEELTFDDITTGASADIKQATSIAKSMVTKFGMSDKLGMVCYGDDDSEVFIGKDLAHAKGYAEQTASIIDEEVRRIVSDCYQKAKDIIIKYKDVLEASANLLLEKEKITGEEFDALFVSE